MDDAAESSPEQARSSSGSDPSSEPRKRQRVLELHEKVRGLESERPILRARIAELQQELQVLRGAGDVNLELENSVLRVEVRRHASFLRRLRLTGSQEPDMQAAERERLVEGACSAAFSQLLGLAFTSKDAFTRGQDVELPAIGPVRFKYQYLPKNVTPPSRLTLRLQTLNVDMPVERALQAARRIYFDHDGVARHPLLCTPGSSRPCGVESEWTSAGTAHRSAALFTLSSRRGAAQDDAAQDDRNHVYMLAAQGTHRVNLDAMLALHGQEAQEGDLRGEVDAQCLVSTFAVTSVLPESAGTTGATGATGAAAAVQGGLASALPVSSDDGQGILVGQVLIPRAGADRMAAITICSVPQGPSAWHSAESALATALPEVDAAGNLTPGFLADLLASFGPPQGPRDDGGAAAPAAAPAPAPAPATAPATAPEVVGETSASCSQPTSPPQADLD